MIGLEREFSECFYCASAFRNTATYAAQTPKSSRNANAVCTFINAVELHSLFTSSCSVTSSFAASYKTRNNVS